MTIDRKLLTLRTERVFQNNQEFLIGTFDINQVRKFTKYTERLIVGFDDDNLPMYNDQIQRRLNKSKVNSIADYLILDKDAMFPTNILIAIPNAAIDSIEENGKKVTVYLRELVFEEMTKSKGDVYLTIIDGQHRIRGIEKAVEKLNDILYKATEKDAHTKEAITNLELKVAQEKFDNLLKFQLVVSFFIDPTLEYEAMLFSTINRTQSRVSENLVYDLFGVTINDSPQKSSLEITLALNASARSPLFDRVRLAGGNYEKGISPTLSQATVVKNILKLICGSLKEAEKERHLERKMLKKSIKLNTPFRIYYANDEDEKIQKILYYFFNAVKSTFIDKNGLPFWNLAIDTKIDNILQTTVGFEALIMLLKDILIFIDSNDSYKEEMKFKLDTYMSFLENAKKLNFSDISEEGRYLPTSKTRTTLYNDFKSKLKI